MTLIVGIQCSDGIVVGSDGAATMGSLGNMTVRQSVKKLTSIDDKVIMGVSGSVGIGQMYRGAITKSWEDKKVSGKKPHEAMAILRDILASQLEPEFKIASTARTAIGDHLAVQSVLCSAVIAIPIGKQGCLFQFNHQCSPEMATPDLPFVAIGSGQNLADPFLAFIRRIFWPDKAPTLADGILAAVWTLKHAILTNPGGVADPIQVMTLQDGVVIDLSKDALGEHYQAICDAEKALANFRDTLSPPEGNQANEPPAAPP